jgi:aryl-alcohol dehydrogenase-like predicted oxidoreductase
MLARYERMLLIPATTSVAHLEENLAAIRVELDADDLAGSTMHACDRSANSAVRRVLARC